MKKELTIEGFGGGDDDGSFAIQLDGHDVAIVSRGQDANARATVPEWNRMMDTLQALLIANPLFIEVDDDGEAMRREAESDIPGKVKPL